jgi:hypothetical protein
VALDPNDLTEIGKLIAAAVAPIAAKVDPAEVGKIVKAHMDEAKKGLVTAEDLKKREEEAAAKAKADADAEAKRKADEEAAKKGGKGKDGEKDPAVAALEAELDKIKKQAAAAEEAAKAEREKARTTALHSAARNALTKAGIPEDRVDTALDVLKARGALAYDGDNAGMKGKNDVGLDAVLPFEKAIPEWVKGDGKLFLPPAGTNGTGEGRGNGGGNGGGGGEVSLDSLRLGATGTVLGALAKLS